MPLTFPTSPTNGQTVTLSSTTYTYNATKGVWEATASGGGFVAGSFSENILPDTDNTYDIGSASYKIRDLYVSDNSLHIGDHTMSADSEGINIPALKLGTGSNRVKLTANAEGKLRQIRTVGGVAQAEEGISEGGKTNVYADMPALIAKTGMLAGDTALVVALNKMYIYNGSGWYLIATVANDSPSAITGVGDGYTLSKDGTATIITAVSTDPEGFALTWSYAITSGTLGNTATISHSDNVFTITPSTTASDAGVFSVTFSATDGATGAVNTVSQFVLAFAPDFSLTTEVQTLDNTTAVGAGDYFGSSISIDGNTMVIGDPSADSNRGAGYVYINPNHPLEGTWTFQQKLQYSGTGGYPSYNTDYQMGFAVKVRGDDIVLGAKKNPDYADSAFRGASFIFKRTGTTWAQKMYNSHWFTYDNGEPYKYGYEVDIIEDDAVFVGRSSITSGVYDLTIYKYNWNSGTGKYNSNGQVRHPGGTGMWKRNKEDASSNSHGYGARWARSFAISGDTTTLVVGAPYRDMTADTVNQSANADGSISIMIADATANGGYALQEDIFCPAQDWQPSSSSPHYGIVRFGFSCDISNDGNTVVVGAPSASSAIRGNHAGKVYVYTRSGTTWTLEATIDPAQPPYGNDQGFGVTCQISPDGKTIVAGRQQSTQDANAASTYGGTSTEIFRIFAKDSSNNTWSLVKTFSGSTALNSKGYGGGVGYEPDYSVRPLAIDDTTIAMGSTLGGQKVFVYRAPGQIRNN